MPIIFRLRLRPHSASPHRRGHPALVLLITSLLAAVLLETGPAARAATYSVSTVTQLDQAFSSAVNGDTIQIAAGTYDLDRGFVLRSSITVVGAGAGLTILDGRGGHPFQVYNSSVALSGLTFQDCRSSDGGALDNEGGTTSLTGCAFTGNTASGDEGGGALYNGGTMTLTSCTLSGNTASNGIGGAILNGGTLTLTDCTLASNTATSASDGGGAINNQGGSVTMTGCALTGNSSTSVGGAIVSYSGLTMTACTIAQNSANSGGGIFSDNNMTMTDCALTGNSSTGSDSVGGALYNGGNASLTNCILTGNTSSGQGNNAGAGAIYSSHSLTVTGCTFNGNSASEGVVGAIFNAGTATLTNDILYGDTAALGSELANGGTLNFSYCDVQNYNVQDANHNKNADPLFFNAPTDLHLKSGSPCAGAGTAGAPAYFSTDLDERTRPNPPSIGAYEAAPSSPLSVVVENTGDSLPLSLRAAVQCADDYGTAAALPAITFDSSVFKTALTITLTSGDINLSVPMTITAPAPGVAVSGNNAGQVFEISGGTSSTPISLGGLTVENGTGSEYGDGGAIQVDGESAVLLTSCTLTGNTSNIGGAIDNNGTATLTGCTLSGNSSLFGGGAIDNNGNVTLTRCVLVGNSGSPPYGGGSALYNAGTATLTGCTLSDNSGPEGCLFNAGAATLIDDIFYGDSGGEILAYSGSATAAYCDIGEALGANGDGVTDEGHNLNANPMFVNAPADLHVEPGSPVVGAGIAVAGNATDITGTLRANPPTVGAYEGQQAGTRTALKSSLNPCVYGQSVTFTATVTNTATGTTPTGTVQFTANGADLGGPVTLGPNGMASVMTTTLPTGSVTVTATFMGTSFQTSSATLIQTVLIANSTALASSRNPSVYGNSVTFTATVNTHGGPAPQGSVQFAVDNVNTGAPVPVSGTQASLAAAGLSVGQHTVTATFMGTGFQTSNASLTQTVSQATVTGVSVGWGSQAGPLTAGATLPWLGIKTLIVTLNAPAGLSSADVTLTGKAVASYGPVSVSASGSVYILTLAKPITAPDRLTLSIGNSGITSYTTSFAVLPGDVNGNGAVNASDLTLVKNAIGGTYKQTDDIDGSGVVDITDYNAAKQRVGAKLP